MGPGVTSMKWVVKGKKKAQVPFGLQTQRWHAKLNSGQCFKVKLPSGLELKLSLRPLLTREELPDDQEIADRAI